MTLQELIDYLTEMVGQGVAPASALVEVLHSQDSNDGVSYFGTPIKETIQVVDDGTRVLILGS
jgi:hypothetical protein